MDVRLACGWSEGFVAGVRWCFEVERMRLGMSTYQSWNCVSGSVSLGCMVTYRIPGVDLDAMMLSLFTIKSIADESVYSEIVKRRKVFYEWCNSD